MVGIHNGGITETADQTGRRGNGDAVHVVVLNLPTQVPVTLAEIEVVESYLGLLLGPILDESETIPETIEGP